MANPPGPQRPIADRRYLPKGPFVPYRLGELVMVLLDIAVILLAIKGAEMYHSNTKGRRLIDEWTVYEVAEREKEVERNEFLTARRDSLLIVEQEVLAVRHADSLAMADLDTAIVLTVAEIEAIAVELGERRKDSVTAAGLLKSAKRDRTNARVKLLPAQREIDDVELMIAALQDSIANEYPEIQVAQNALEYEMSRRPEVVVPQTSSASLATQIAQGDLYATVGLGHSFFNLGRGQLGLSALTAFGPERTTVSGGGLFFNVPLIPQKLSLDIGSGAAVLIEGDGTTDTSPYVGGQLRFALSQTRRLFLLGDSRASHDRVWTGVGIGVGRR